jgi:hypothetical protein
MIYMVLCSRIVNDNILSELYADKFSNVSSAQMNGTETLDTDVLTRSSCEWA